MRRRAFLVSILGALAIVPAGAAQRDRVTLTLDWTPNADHAGFYVARDTGLFSQAGLDVAIRAPSDPTAPLKLVAAGSSDLAVSYEQELFFASAKKLPVVAVAAVVPRPLNSIIAVNPAVRSVRDLARRTIGITGVPSDYATLDTVLDHAGLSRKDVKVVNVGYNLLPALLAHRVDAVLGAYRNVEGIQLQQRGLHPTVIPVDRAGVPTYDELVLVASAARLRSDPHYRSLVKRFVTAFLAGTAQARHNPARTISILEKVTASEPAFLARSTRATLGLLAGPRGVGCLQVDEWRRFGAWMHARALLARAPATSSLVTTRFLPARCTQG